MEYRIQIGPIYSITCIYVALKNSQVLSWQPYGNIDIQVNTSKINMPVQKRYFQALWRRLEKESKIWSINRRNMTIISSLLKIV